jgi:hypothetical protein
MAVGMRRRLNPAVKGTAAMLAATMLKNNVKLLLFVF